MRNVTEAQQAKMRKLMKNYKPNLRRAGYCIGVINICTGVTLELIKLVVIKPY